MHALLSFVFWIVVIHWAYRVILFWVKVFALPLIVGFIGAMMGAWTVGDIVPYLAKAQIVVFEFMYQLFNIPSDPRMDARTGADVWLFLNFIVWIGIPTLFYFRYLGKNWSSLKERFLP